MLLVCPKCGLCYSRSLERCGLDGEPLVESSTDPLIDRGIDRYRVKELIGRGGMARVYRATHLFLDRDVALKVMNGELAMDRTLARRFQREAKVLSAIRHENVVRLGDFGVTEHGLLYMAMELVDGQPLNHIVRQEGPMDSKRAGMIVRQIACGLKAAHDRGYIHRDLKPGNVLVGPDDQVKILDFGLVRLLDVEDAPEVFDTQLTKFGQVFGTPLYMSPEQIGGEEVGPGSDLYALGVILYELLVGRPPFTGDVARLAWQHLSSVPPDIGFHHFGLTELAHRLLAKRAGDRPATADEVIATIDSLDLQPERRVADTRVDTGWPDLGEMRSAILDLELDSGEPAFVGPGGTSDLTMDDDVVEAALQLPQRPAAVINVTLGALAVAAAACAWLLLASPKAEVEPLGVESHPVAFVAQRYTAPARVEPRGEAPAKAPRVAKQRRRQVERAHIERADLARRLTKVFRTLGRVEPHERDAMFELYSRRASALKRQLVERRSIRRRLVERAIEDLDGDVTEYVAERVAERAEKEQRLDDALERIVQPNGGEAASVSTAAVRG